MTGGYVSDLLSRPKPWASLSLKGRESYTKMVEFLANGKILNNVFVIAIIFKF